MNILITGGAGFIGSHLTKKLLETGHNVTILDNFSAASAIDNIKKEYFKKTNVIEADVRDGWKGLDHFKNIDIVFHLAGVSSLPTNQSHPYMCFSINTAGTANILECSRLANVKKIVFASTSAIYENSRVFPCKENSTVTPNLFYSQSKLFAENICKSYINDYGMDITMIRYFNVYGPGQDLRRSNPPLTGYMFKCLMENETPVFYSDGKQKRDYVYIDDIVDLNILCSVTPLAKNEIFNACSGKTYSVNEIYTLMSKLLKKEIHPVYNNPAFIWEKYKELIESKFPLKSSVIESEVKKFTLGCNMKVKNLGWTCKIDMEEGLTKMIKEYKEESTKEYVGEI